MSQFSSKTCASCCFCSPGTTKAFPDVSGMCRRYATSGVVIGSHSKGWQIFPPMKHDSWCGDFRPDPALVNRAQAAA